MNRRLALVLLVSVTGLSVACSSHGGLGETSGKALPAPAGQNASAPGLPFAGAPRVADPLPLSVLAGDPCSDALTPDQVVAAVGASVSGQREDLAEVGPACAWSNRDTGGAVGVSYTLNTHVGLSGVYANTKPQSALWRELPAIQGFPAVAHAGAKGGTVPAGFCQASIGLADNLSIDVSLTLGVSKKDTEDACSLISQIADMTVTTLRAKAGS
ncbi:DUF3558 domain-containing protein [Amycolatopsis sp. WQ 127309]|uniref:DUF3558 domain-containing protein n=1 Tax=Amycolatopsis sp. WQ 127309 TaxID=2932773 RepID=UPI001FF49138|nr:DUF3558 domain-containing protein [Amycolatopsis sp. WQ 127309]UOZ03300.1 DUF3558 domain-containing protein [Amycolatopsis sp. WQ 127309]